MRDNQYEYEYHYVANDADYIDMDHQDEDLQTQHEIQDEYEEHIKEYNNYYHDIVDELDD